MDAFSRQNEVEYRRLLWELASKMNEKDARHLAFLYSIKDWTDSLNVLETLDTQSVLSSTNLEGLRKVTQDLGRKELVRWLEAKIQCLCLLSTPNTQHTACSYYCNPQLKSHFESILPLNSLLISHTKILRNILESILPANTSSRGTDTIKRYVQNAERKFREAEQDLMFACRKVGYWRSGDKLEPYPAFEMSATTTKNSTAKTKLRNIKNAMKRNPRPPVTQCEYIQPNQSYITFMCQETTREVHEETSSSDGYEEIDREEEQADYIEERVYMPLSAKAQQQLFPLAEPKTTATYGYSDEEDSSDEDDTVEEWLQPSSSISHEARPANKEKRKRMTRQPILCEDTHECYRTPRPANLTSTDQSQTHSEAGIQHEEECKGDYHEVADCTGDSGYSESAADYIKGSVYEYHHLQHIPSPRHHSQRNAPGYTKITLEDYPKKTTCINRVHA